MDDFREWSRPIPGQDSEVADNYDFEELRDNGQRQRSAAEHAHEISLWLWSMRMFAEAYPALGRTYSSGALTVEGTANQQYWTRQSLLMLSARAMKPALDLVLSCYYTEAWSLLRTSLDGWGRAVFVRLQPEEYVRWVQAGEEERSTKRGPDWLTIEEIVCIHGDEQDRELFDAAHLRWRILNHGVHPSGLGLAQTDDRERGIMTFRPEYGFNLCRVSLSLGVFVQQLLLDEVVRLDPHSALWKSHRIKLLDHTRSLIHCISRDLEAEAKELEAIRSANPNALRPCVQRRWGERLQPAKQTRRSERPEPHLQESSCSADTINTRVISRPAAASGM